MHCLFKHTNGKIVLSAYGDADWANDLEDRRSVSGILVTINDVPVHWRSMKQIMVTHSSTESELIALDLAAREVLWFRKLLTHMGLAQTTPTTVYQDNQSTMKLASEPIYRQRTKHIEVRYFAIREWIEKLEIKLQYLPTNQMVADGFTKPLTANKHQQFTKLLNMQDY